MMSFTHMAIALSGTSLLLGTSEPSHLILGLIGSQMPDIDTTKSTVGRAFYPLASWIEQRYPHRTITHCLWLSLGLAIAGLVPAYLLNDWKIGLACALGHLLSCLSDTCTKEGVALFYPNTDRCVYGSNPNIRLSTGSKAEYWILAFFAALTIFALNLQSAGGLMVNFNQLLGMPDGAVQLYNRYGNENHVFVNVRGVMAGDRQKVDEQFFVVGQDGQKLVLQNNAGLFRVGSEILATRVSGKVAAAASVRAQNIYLNDEDLFAALLQVYQGNQGAAIYVSGNITIDAPEDIIKLSPPNQMPVIDIGESGAVELNFAPIEIVGRALQNQYAIGPLSFKIIYPAPSLTNS